MVSGMKSFLFLLFTFLGIQHFILNPAVARDLTITPTLSLTGMHNTNYFFDPSDAEKTELDSLIVSPLLDLTYNEPGFHLDTQARLDLIRYADESQLDTENQWYHLNTRYAPSNLCWIFGEFTHANDRRFERFNIAPPGLESQQIDLNLASPQKTYIGTAGLTYEVSPFSDIGFDLGYSSAVYDEDNSNSSDKYSANASYSRFFNNNRDSISILPAYYHLDSGVAQTDYYGLSVGWSHYFARDLSTNVSVGGQHTEETEGPIETDDRGGRASFSLTKKGKRNTITVNYAYDAFSSSGKSIEVHATTWTFTSELTQRLSFTFYGMLYWPENTIEGASGIDYANFSDYYELAPTFNYQMTKNISWVLSGDYTLYDQADRERTRVWLTIRLEFPKKL